MNFSLRKLVFVVLTWLASGPTICLHAAVARNMVSGGFQISIDGVVYANARAWEGGDLVADIIAEPASAGGIQKKHVTNIQVSPLRVELIPDNSPGLLALMNEVFTNKTASHTVSLTGLDAARKAVDLTEFIGTSVTGLELNAYDGSAKESSVLTLTFQPSQVRRSKLPGTTVVGGGGPRVATLASNFRFALDGLPTTRVASVSALKVQRTLPATVGLSREPGAATTTLGFTNLIVTISNADLSSWQTWENDFLVQGKRLDADEKKGALTQLASNLSTVLFEIQLDHVGLVRLSQSGAANTDTLQRFEVELYFEGASVSNTSSPAATTPADTKADGTTKPDPTTPAGTTADTTTPAAGTQTGGTAAGSTTPNPNLASATNPAILAKNPNLANIPITRPVNLPTATSLRSTDLRPAATASGATSFSTGDPADQGVRDAREFLRVDGMVRKTYQSTDFEASSEETVTYTSKLSIDDLVAKYESALKSANWEQTRRDESGSAADYSRYFNIKWTKTVQQADLRFYQTKEGGSKLTINVDSRRSGVLSGLAAAMKDAGAELAAKEGSPNDLGAHDPTDFPRISRSTRKSFSSYGSAETPTEDAVYRAKVAIASVEAFYVNQLNQGDWEQSVRREEGDPLGASHEISMTWTRGKRTVKIRLREVEPAITEISISLSTSSS